MIANQKFELFRDGFCIQESVYDDLAVDQLRKQIASALSDNVQSALESKGTIFAARNLIDSIPDLLNCVNCRLVCDLLGNSIGQEYGLIRALYFDKPSNRSWNLPFHKDLTIAVKDNTLPTNHFSKPTRKGGVDHVEASEEVLENMLTIRIHLDDVTERNGPLEVIPGSHLSGKKNVASDQKPVKILVSAGDVLAMRPLLSHGSGHTDPNGNLRRRILHLEYCGQSNLPDGYQWKHFLCPDGESI